MFVGQTLGGDGRPPLPGGTVPTATTGGVKAPYAGGHDWAKIDKALSAEMFQKIYADAITNINGSTSL